MGGQLPVPFIANSPLPRPHPGIGDNFWRRSDPVPPFALVGFLGLWILGRVKEGVSHGRRGGALAGRWEGKAEAALAPASLFLAIDLRRDSVPSSRTARGPGDCQELGQGSSPKPFVS